MSGIVLVRRWLFYWVAWVGTDGGKSFRSFSKDGAVAKARSYRRRPSKWKYVET